MLKNNKTLIYFLLICPFFKPEIIDVFQALALLDTIYDLWRLISVLVMIFLFCRCRKINVLLVLFFLYFGWIFFVSVINSVGLFHFFSQCGSIIALCLFISMCYTNGDIKDVLKIIVNLLMVYLLINALTVFIFAPQGGIVSDIEGARNNKHNYFLGYDNRHVYLIIPYLALSLVYDRLYCGIIRWRTIIAHVIINIAVLMCWSADTVVAVVVFYALLICARNRYIAKLINSYTIILINAITFYFLVIVKLSQTKISLLIEKILHKDIGFTREKIWNSYLSFVYKAPIIGNGYIYKERHSLTGASHAHNMYLDVLFVSGAIGLFLFVTIIFLSTNSGKAVLSKNQQIIIVAIAAYMVAFQATASPYCPTFYLLLILSYELGSYDKKSIDVTMDK